MSGTPEDLAGVWLHAHEEDTASAMVFRPRGYALKPARWRDAIEISPDGTCIWHGSSPDDRGQAFSGRWEDLGGGQARISIPDAAGGSFPGQVRSWAPDKLVIGK